MSAHHRSFGLALGLLVVIAILVSVRTNSKHDADFEAVVPDCPIVWATYTYGTNHTLFLRKGRPMSSQYAGRILWWMDIAAWHVAHRSLFEIRFVRRSSPGPALVVHVGLKGEVRSDRHPELLVFLTDQRKSRTLCSQFSGLKAEWIYHFEGLTGAVHGRVVEFIPSNEVNPVAKLKL
jgi:hypothetical protein